MFFHELGGGVGVVPSPGPQDLTLLVMFIRELWKILHKILRQRYPYIISQKWTGSKVQE